MANKRISDLPEATSSTVGDVLPIDGTTTRKITVENLLDVNLVALKGLTSAADKVPYFTGSGAAAVSDFTSAGRDMVGAANAAAQTALLSNVVGDSGSGGTKGLVPAPAAGDAAAGKFLKANGTWSTPAGGGDVTGPASSTDNALARFDSTSGKIIQNSEVTLGDADGKLSRTGGISVQGTNTNDSAAAGYVGEYQESEVLSGSAVSLTTTTAANVTSLSLTAGDWDVCGDVVFSPGGATTVTLLVVGINTVSGTMPVSPGKGSTHSLQIPFTTGQAQVMPTGTRRISISSTTTVYLLARADFGASTLSAYGILTARRAR